ncbi:MAG: antibiotic biosynthesis monooxygenase family protein [Bacteroidota bacterium]
MIIRIVRMKFLPEKVDEFTALFEERKHIIRGFPGCTHLELWQDSNDPHVFVTYSHWASVADLDHYRFSGFFKDTWGTTKALFADKPQAWSVIRASTT